MKFEFPFLHPTETPFNTAPALLTLDDMRAMWPKGNEKVPGLVEGIASSAPAVFAKYGITSQLVVAHLMAQFSHECGAGHEMEENLNYSASALVRVWPTRYTPELAVAYEHRPVQIANKSYNGRMGNREGTNDGWDYRGRGLAQCTGRDEYVAVKKLTGIDVVSHPEYLSDPKYALECAVAIMKKCGCIPYALHDDLVCVSAMLNVGHLVRDPKTIVGLDQRVAWLEQWKTRLGLEKK